MFNAFPIGTSALQTGQRAIDLIGQNVANASTPGYHRQSVNLVNRTDGVGGTGVDIASITRYTAPPVRTAIISGNSDQAALATKLDSRQQVEATLRSGKGGIGDRLESLFNQIEQLTGQPDSSASRRGIVVSAGDLAGQLNTAAGDIDRLRSDLGSQVPTVVGQINDLTTRIADLNLRITTASNRNNPVNELRDQRDQFIEQLSQLADIKTVEVPSGEINVIGGGTVLVAGEFANKLSSDVDATGTLVVRQENSTQPLTFPSGKLGALLGEYNTEIPATRGRLDALAGQLIQRFNAVQATGLGVNGPVTSATGVYGASSSTVPLNAANLPYPITAGQLTVSVTDATGNRTNTTLNIDPATQSLQDIATALSGVPGLQASVDPAANTLQIQAQSGFRFDFAGRDSNPAGSGAVANTDTAGLLTGLGVGGLFSGSNAASIAVRPEILNDPSKLAGSRTGLTGDSTNLERFAAIRDQVAVGTRTLSEDFADIAATVGSDISSLNDQQAVQSNALRNLSAQEQATAGVDVNEELLHLLDYQRMVEGASKYLSVVNSTFDALLSIIN